MNAALLPAGLVRSLALAIGAGAAMAATWRLVLPVIATSDLASAALIVGGSGVTAWAAARASEFPRMTVAQSFAAGLTLPVSAALLIPSRRPRAANDNDHPFSGSWPQFISE